MSFTRGLLGHRKASSLMGALPSDPALWPLIVPSLGQGGSGVQLMGSSDIPPPQCSHKEIEGSPCMGAARMMTTPFPVSGRCFIPPPHLYVYIGSCPENTLLAMMDSSFSHHTLCQVPVLESPEPEIAQTAVYAAAGPNSVLISLLLWVPCPCPA